MSLIGFHRVLIGSAVLFCLLFGGMSGADFLRDGGSRSLVIALVFGGGALLFGYYLLHLDRFLGREERR